MMYIGKKKTMVSHTFGRPCHTLADSISQRLDLMKVALSSILYYYFKSLCFCQTHIQPYLAEIFLNNHSHTTYP